MVTVVFRIAIICCLAGGLGLVVNGFSPNGIELFGDVPIKTIPGVDLISLEEAWTMFQSNGGVFIDARSQEEYEKGRIPGAVLLNTDNFEEDITALMGIIPVDLRVITYCSGSGCESSLEVSGLLKEVGYSDIKLFHGGWQHWQKAGHPVETGSSSDES